MKREFAHDIAELGTNGSSCVKETFLGPHWKTLTDKAYRSAVREFVHAEDATVHVAGQGVSLSCAHWFASRLRDRGVRATASNGDAVPDSVLNGDDVVVLISRSGETESICGAADRLSQGSSAPHLLGVTTPETPLADRVDRLVPHSPVTEAARVYPNKSLFVQIATLYTVFLESEPDEETWTRRFGQIQALLDSALTYETEGGSPTAVNIAPGSQFDELVTAFDRRDDLSLDLVVTGTDPFVELASEAAQKYSELLHQQTTHEHLGSIRDRQVNVLFAESAFLFAPLPRVADETLYERCHRRLYTGSSSIENLLKFTRNPAPTRLVVTTFNDLTRRIEREVAELSYYGEAGLLMLDSYDEITDDLLVVAAIYLFVLAVLEERWDRDSELRQTIIAKCYDPNVI